MKHNKKLLKRCIHIFSISVTIPLLNFGMVQGWLSPMLLVLQTADGPAPEPYTSEDISWVTSVTYITAIIFGIPMGYLTDKFGRKNMTLLTLIALMVIILFYLIYVFVGN